MRPYGRGLHAMGWIVALLVAVAACGNGDSAGSVVVLDASDEQIAQAALTWVNMLGLAQTDVELWRHRLERACGEGVWNEDVARALAEEFIAEDLPVSVRSPQLGPPATGEGAQALWLMAVNVCRDAFSPDAIESGPPQP